jgi:hypothetical protein
MDVSSLVMLAGAAVGCGAGLTYLMAQWLPDSLAASASRHGRFTGLGEAEHVAAPAAPHGRRTQGEALNVVRTAQY